MAIWEPNIGDEHDLKREPGNKEDINAVAVVRMKDEYRLSSKRDRTQRSSKWANKQLRSCRSCTQTNGTMGDKISKTSN